MNEKFEKLSMYKITLLRRQDERQHRRLGLNRENGKDFVWIVEKPTIDECLDATIEFLSSLSEEEFLRSTF